MRRTARYHLVFFTPWFPEAVKNPDVAKKFVAEWNARKLQRRRPHRGLPRLGRHPHHRRGDQGRPARPTPEAIQKALWNVKVKGINGDIAFIKQGPAGKESAQNVPSVYVVKIDNGKVVKN